MGHLYVKTMGSGQPLVLLHGWGWHSGIFTPLIPQLVQYYQLFLVDLPGFGQSGLPFRDYTFENIAALLFEKVPSKAIWLGWSLGGLLAWWIAIHHPEKVMKLITVAASPRFTATEDWPGVSEVTLAQFSQSLLTDPEQTLNTFLRLQLRGSAVVDVPLSVSLPEALLGGVHLLQTTDLRADLSHLACPSLHIFGRLDMLVPVKTALQLSALISPYARCEIIKNAGHIPFLSQAGIFLELVT